MSQIRVCPTCSTDFGPNSWDGNPDTCPTCADQECIEELTAQVAAGEALYKAVHKWGQGLPMQSLPHELQDALREYDMAGMEIARAALNKGE